MGGFFAVDSFYFMSGFLVSMGVHSFLNKEQVTTKSWLLMYAHRWLRLSPLYFVVIWVYSELMPYFGDGPLYYGNDNNSIQGELLSEF